MYTDLPRPGIRLSRARSRLSEPAASFLTRCLKEVGEIYQQTTQARECSEQRIHDKWTQVIRGARIVEDTLTGEFISLRGGRL